MGYTTLNANEDTIKRIDILRESLVKQLGFKISRMELIEYSLHALEEFRGEA